MLKAGSAFAAPILIGNERKQSRWIAMQREDSLVPFRPGRQSSVEFGVLANAQILAEIYVLFEQAPVVGGTIGQSSARARHAPRPQCQMSGPGKRVVRLAVFHGAADRRKARAVSGEPFSR